MKIFLSSLTYAALLLCALVALMTSGCTSTPTHVNRGPIHAATFDFVARSTGPKASNFERDEAVYAMIQEAVTANLASRGVTRVADAPDIKVAFLIIVGDNVSTMAVNDYFGYGRDEEELVNKAHKAYTIDNRNPDSFEAGTLLIDILDGKTFKLLMRSYVVRPLQRDATPEVRQARVREAVDEVLKGVRIVQ